VTLGDQFIGNAHALFGRRVLPHQIPDAFESLLVGLKDDHPILDTSEKIATIREADFGAQDGRKNHSAIIRHLYMRLRHDPPLINAIGHHDATQ
jgi:hypothetical protein